MKREPQWEQWEDDTIARLYPVEGWRAVNRVLTHRTKGAINSRAVRKGIPGQPRYSRPRREERKLGAFLLPWSNADIEACRLLREWRGPVAPDLGNGAGDIPAETPSALAFPPAFIPNLGLRP